ncbi:septal ring lytic transglycosylase RlpA family protein [Camelimonas abortus]|uniref:Endolytic peptidoglycan transglycosylase RlpA n=1 Tax=Camelimonas abortus TaxID=1017184 RepID=A0ABV7LFY0_9HYPH
MATGYAQANSRTFEQHGVASWYGPGFYGRKTASGERYTGAGLTAAHRTLPFGSLARVTDKRTGRSIVVRINDRGPFRRGRVIDLSRAAARALGMNGLAHVVVTPLVRTADARAR